MIVVACSGFPVPASRYFAEFRGVEVSDTEIGIPGDGTVRRWLREAGKGFVFTALAPKPIVGSGFVRSKESREHLDAISAFAATLSARAIVFSAPSTFEPTKANKAAAKAFVAALPKGFPTAVLDFPAWPTAATEQAAGSKAVAAFDPLAGAPSKKGALAYLTLPGPAGHRSRYDDDAIARIAESARALKSDLVVCVFRNQDMHTNALALMKALG